MAATPAMPVFDGHNDVLLRLHLKNRSDVQADFLGGDGEGHIDLPRARAGGLAGGLFAMFAPNEGDPVATPTGDVFSPPLAEPVALTEAQAHIAAMASLLLRIERASAGAARLCRSAADIRAAMADGALACVAHIEGAEAIDPGFHALDVLHAAGLRSLGPVWSRPNVFGHGVPFRFPQSPDTGDGLTDLGRELVRRCNRLRIMVDLSHITEKGFWDVAAISDAPLVATHSNAHAVCASSRNLTDRQIAAIAERGGMIGLNFANGFLRPDGRSDADTGFDVLMRHLDHLVGIAGIGCVGLGSDFDGADVPAAIGDVAGLPHLVEALRAHGVTGDDLERLCWRNWLDVLERTWGG